MKTSLLRSFDFQMFPSYDYWSNKKKSFLVLFNRKVQERHFTIFRPLFTTETEERSDDQ
jgi:hypothetical protein